MFHYCSLDSFKAIIESRSIWASSSRYLNDFQEVHYSQESLGKWEKLILKDISDFDRIETVRQSLARVANADNLEFFVASFCKKPDKLSQWRGYADAGRGVSIGFSSSAFAGRHCADVSYRKTLEEAAAVCVQLRNESKSMTEEEFRKICTRRFIELVGLTKGSGFLEEEECRLLGFTHEFSEDEIKIRRSISFLVPYVTISVASSWPDCIEEIWLGPLLTSPQTKESIEYFLKRNGLNRTVVNESRVSLR